MSVFFAGSKQHGKLSATEFIHQMQDRPRVLDLFLSFWWSMMVYVDPWERLEMQSDYFHYIRKQSLRGSRHCPVIES